MSECRFCAAPVDRREKFCSYCDSRLEIDLHGALDYRLYEPNSERICPHCDMTLDTIDIDIDGKFLVEKCSQCNGMFFDPGELEMILDRSVSNVFHIDQSRLKQLQSEAYATRPTEIKYVKCPACQTLMHRVGFGHRSSVIVDHCGKHGIWLDEGELRQLQEWKKAGGLMRQEAASKGYGHEPSVVPSSAGGPSASANLATVTYQAEREQEPAALKVFKFVLDLLD